MDAEGCCRSLAAYKDNYKGVTMTDVEHQKRIEVLGGGDVAKGAHHAVALDLSEFSCSRHIMTYRSRYAEREEIQRPDRDAGHR